MIEPSTQSYEDFFRVAFGRIRAAAARIVGPHEAEDVAVEALARAYARWSSVAKMEYPQAWVMRVAVNLALDQVRRRPRHETTPALRDPADDVALRADLIDALRGLSRRQREVVVLRHLIDMPEAEVARALGVSEGSVKTHLHRALRELKVTLSDEEWSIP